MTSGVVRTMMAAAVLAAAAPVSVPAQTEDLAQTENEVQAWEGKITIATYPWRDDINPKFWALEGGARLSTTVHAAITYPYVAQDHLSRTKTSQTYKALFLENEYLKVTCLPELGGRLHSVLDKTENVEMFHLNRVIKPGMIAMRGAWISGGVEWNSGPHGHTVTAVSPVNALVGSNPDGSAFLEISNQEQIFRTRWTVRVTLHPGRAFLDEQIRLYNPTDGMHPYYFWNCTAFPNRPGTRFIYPMTLGTDHNAREFFRWPVHEGRDLTWLKDYKTAASVFAVECSHDFFGAYDVDADRGIVQFANHHELGGKKAWTWGESASAKVAQQNLTDGDGPYIEVQSGPLPTQSDYGMLGPREQVSWREYWYPVHGLGDGFEYATRDLAAQSSRRGDQREIKFLATGRFPQATCLVASQGKRLARLQLDLSPDAPAAIVLDDAVLDDAVLDDAPPQPLDVVVRSRTGQTLAAFTTPLPTAWVEPPATPGETQQPEDQLSAEQLYLKGRQLDRASDRIRAREFYDKALQRDPQHLGASRGLAVLDYESGRYAAAIDRLTKALQRDGDDGLCWFYLGVCRWRTGDDREALRCGYRATRCPGAVSLGWDLVGRAAMRLGDKRGAIAAFQRAVKVNGDDPAAADHLMLALYAAGRRDAARLWAERRVREDPTAVVAHAVNFLLDDGEPAAFARQVQTFLGEDEFEMLEASLRFAELGLTAEAIRLVQATCVDPTPLAGRGFLPLYYLAWFESLRGDAQAARQWLRQAAATRQDKVFASRLEEEEILQYAVQQNPNDAQAHLQLGCLWANFGRLEEAIGAWQTAAALDAGLSVAWRNLGLAAAASQNDLASAQRCYRQAIAARPDDQTLYRDLAEILDADGKRTEAIQLLETMPLDVMRRGEITVMLAEYYLDEQRYDDCVRLLEATPFFVNWEGQSVTWRLFNKAHVERGRQHLERGDREAALADFEAALTYPANLNVGRSDKPEEAPAQFWRGKALAALGRREQATEAWRAGADGALTSSSQREYVQRCREMLSEK